MHLIYMNENPKWRWGYKENEEDTELVKEVGMVAEQRGNESCEDFFKRVGDKPAKNMYGSDESRDANVIQQDSFFQI